MIDMCHKNEYIYALILCILLFAMESLNKLDELNAQPMQSLNNFDEQDVAARLRALRTDANSVNFQCVHLTAEIKVLKEEITLVKTEENASKEIQNLKGEVEALRAVYSDLKDLVTEIRKMNQDKEGDKKFQAQLDALRIGYYDLKKIIEEDILKQKKRSMSE